MQEWKQKYELIAATSNQAYSIFCGFCSKEFDDMSKKFARLYDPNQFYLCVCADKGFVEKKRFIVSTKATSSFLGRDQILQSLDDFS